MYKKIKKIFKQWRCDHQFKLTHKSGYVYDYKIECIKCGRTHII